MYGSHIATLLALTTNESELHSKAKQLNLQDAELRQNISALYNILSAEYSRKFTDVTIQLNLIMELDFKEKDFKKILSGLLMRIYYECVELVRQAGDPSGLQTIGNTIKNGTKINIAQNFASGLFGIIGGIVNEQTGESAAALGSAVGAIFALCQINSNEEREKRASLFLSLVADITKKISQKEQRVLVEKVEKRMSAIAEMICEQYKFIIHELAQHEDGTYTFASFFSAAIFKNIGTACSGEANLLRGGEDDEREAVQLALKCINSLDEHDSLYGRVGNIGLKTFPNKDLGWTIQGVVLRSPLLIEGFYYTRQTDDENRADKYPIQILFSRHLHYTRASKEDAAIIEFKLSIHPMRVLSILSTTQPALRAKILKRTNVVIKELELILEELQFSIALITEFKLLFGTNREVNESDWLSERFKDTLKARKKNHTSHLQLLQSGKLAQNNLLLTIDPRECQGEWNGYNFLHTIVYQNDPEKLKVILNSNAPTVLLHLDEALAARTNVEYKYPYMTPLLMALKKAYSYGEGCDEVVTLLAQRSDPSQMVIKQYEGWSGYNGLHMATEIGRMKLVRSLCESIHPNLAKALTTHATDGIYKGMTPLLMAFKKAYDSRENYDSIIELLARKSDPSQVANNLQWGGNNAINMAVYICTPELLRKICDIWIRTNKEKLKDALNTTRPSALANKYPSAAEILVEYKDKCNKEVTGKGENVTSPTLLFSDNFASRSSGLDQDSKTGTLHTPKTLQPFPPSLEQPPSNPIPPSTNQSDATRAHSFFSSIQQPTQPAPPARNKNICGIKCIVQ
jgi:ankyrin repeat protein